MRSAHTVEQVRESEQALMERLPEGALMQRAAAGLASAVLDYLGVAYGARVLLLVGSMLTRSGLAAPGLAGWLLAPLVILVVRPLLVLATAPPRLTDLRGRLFLGFFGVRGVAALFYAAVVSESGVLAAHEQHVVVWTTITIVVVSIVVHGLTAKPLTSRLLGRP